MKYRPLNWFGWGFILTFILLAVLVPMPLMSPDGSVLKRVSLGLYYVQSVNTWVEPRPLGPAAVSSGELMTVFLQHVGLSLVAGTITMAIGLIVGRSRSAKLSA